MFDVLMSSRAPRTRGMARGVMSAGVHLVVIAGAIRATGGGAPAVAGPVVDTTIFVVEPVPAPPEPAGAASAESPIVAGPRVDAVVPPLDVPPGLPSVEPGPPLDLSRFALGPKVPGGPARGEPDSIAATSVFLAEAVDDPAVVVRQPEPRYPPALLQAGVEGRVVVEFVIDTSGHAEPASPRVIESSNRAFDAAALESIQRSLFRPARVRGRSVRQLTRQAIGFRIRPG